MSLTREGVLAAVREHGTYSKAADSLGVSYNALTTSVYRHGWKADVERARHQHSASVVTDSERTVEFNGEGPLPLGDLERILKDRGLDGSRFCVEGLRVGEWEAQIKGGDIRTLHAIRATVRPREESIVRAALSTRKPVLAPKVRKGQQQLIAVLSDQHIPFHDRELHRRVLRWLTDIQPARILLLGDLLDMDSMSRHPWDARFHSTLQETIDQGHQYVADVRNVCPDAQIDYLLGNHEDRTRQRIIERVREMYGVRRATSSRDALSLEWLLALDELGVVMHTDENLHYDHSQLRLAPGLVARHGHATRRGGGASALAEMERAMHGVVMGHCHRLAAVRRTLINDHGQLVGMWAVEAGTLAMTEGGLGYARQPDWQQGAVTFTLEDGAEPHAELAVASGDRLRWRGQSW